VWSLSVEVARFHSRDQSDPWCSPVWPVVSSGLELWCFTAFSGREVGSWFLGSLALQWLLDLANLGSESETCVGSRVHLVGAFISFEKNFYRLPFTPPSLIHRIGPSISCIWHGICNMMYRHPCILDCMHFVGKASLIYIVHHDVLYMILWSSLVC
jgi:hypothetical protein